jgi:hypothetical protein
MSDLTTRNYTAQEWFDLGNGTVTLCGSTRYFEQCMEINRELTFKEWVVLQCGSWGKSYHKSIEESQNIDYSAVKRLHFVKILKSDCVVVVSDHLRYWGDSTKAEILFAKYHSLPIFYWDGEQLTGSTFREPPQTLTNHINAVNEFRDDFSDVWVGF